MIRPEERNKYKKAVLWQPQSGILVRKSKKRVGTFEIEKYNWVHQAYLFHWNGIASPYDGHQGLQRQIPDTGIDWENPIYVR